MNRQPLTKLILIQTLRGLSSEDWKRLSDSVARMRLIDGCLYCQLYVSRRTPQHWILHGVWCDEPALQTALQQELQGRIENMLDNNALVSIMIYGNDGCLPPLDLLDDIEPVELIQVG
ncbi:putative quinol monooxygenase [Pseudomonas chlororaphis]|uniref:putative quinol monooxygenase n=1 Tax=Pseudomonas chlororaphis TaxID=587753 RepID=UPI002365125A|nr:antibiotic biosynthesis monooxygenase [Pseudomonas chlororaphis]WDH19956.1 hypothetical protein PUP50_18120 [Pseudomonas chlororaphis]